MVRKPEDRGRGDAWTPLDHLTESRAHRDEEIERQAIEDARRSFSTVRDLLTEGVGPDAPSTDATQA